MINKYKNELFFKTTKNKDIFITVILSFILLYFFVTIDLFDKIIVFTRAHEDWELDEIILFILISSFLALWYSVRRYHEMSCHQKKLKILSMNLEEELHREIEKSNKLLKEQNTILEKKVAEAVQEIRKQDNILAQQSKMAAMGEMFESIAHQWKQPLSVITLNASSLLLKDEINVLDRKTIKDTCENIVDNGNYLSATVDDFRNFLKHDKEKKSFKINDLFSNTLKLISANFKNTNIEIEQNINDIEIQGYPNELVQVLLNILNNAKDELIKKDTKKLILIDVLFDETTVTIFIKDNAGGIPKEILPFIFDAYFSSKKDKNGTGIGLFMSKKIILDSFKGSIDAKNTEFNYENTTFRGAEFIIKIPIK